MASRDARHVLSGRARLALKLATNERNDEARGGRHGSHGCSGEAWLLCDEEDCSCAAEAAGVEGSSADEAGCSAAALLTCNLTQS